MTISGFSAHALNQLAGSFGGGSATTVVVDLSRVEAQLAQLNATASLIATTLTNPTWAAGDELCRRAATALEHGWYDDAVRDASGSIDAYPYRGAPYLLRAVALLHLGDAVAAHEQLGLAVKYGKAGEPEHAATAGLLDASLCQAAGLPDLATQALLAADDATGGRCPAVVVAALGARPRSSSELTGLLLSDVAAWGHLAVDDALFGEPGERIRAAAEDLFTAAAAAAAAAGAFREKTVDVSYLDVPFYTAMFDMGSSRYSGHDGLRHYKDGGALARMQPYVTSTAPKLPSLSLFERVAAGHDLILLMAYRTSSQRDIPDGWWADAEFVSEPWLKAWGDDEPRLLDGPALDVMVTDWADIARSVERDDLPRGVGRTAGTGMYLRSLRSRAYYERDRPDVELRAQRLDRPAPSGFRVKNYEREQHSKDQTELRKLRQWLATPPPELGGLSSAISVWVELTAGDGAPVVRPFARMTLPEKPPMLDGPQSSG